MIFKAREIVLKDKGFEKIHFCDNKILAKSLQKQELDNWIKEKNYAQANERIKGLFSSLEAINISFTDSPKLALATPKDSYIDFDLVEKFYIFCKENKDLESSLDKGIVLHFCFPLFSL